jgi:pimeloyl-ACP methyl ester carboxylesterase
LSSPPRHVIVYFQGTVLSFLSVSSFFSSFQFASVGNAGNPLHRIPMFSVLLNAIPSLAILAPAPRSYWTSTAARPTQAGLIADHAAALAFTASRFPTSFLTLYGHSLGASAALCLLAAREHEHAAGSCDVHGLVLENAFTSVPDMLRALYPQRWLPYRYLGPFVRDRWDARAAAHRMRHRALVHRAMVLVSARDEVIPPTMGQQIFDALKPPDGNLGRLVVLDRALHEDAWRHRDWSQAIKQYLCDLERKALR